jgi:hypothetical protein
VIIEMESAKIEEALCLSSQFFVFFSGDSNFFPKSSLSIPVLSGFLAQATFLSPHSRLFQNQC